MALCPFAQQELWSPYSPERFITPTAIILHTNASGGAENPGPTGGLSWHFQVGQHGTIYQHRDTATRAAANVQANAFAISIETWDDGSPDVSCEWTSEQLDALVRLIDWCCTTHNIPRVQPGTWDSAGIGYHRMFAEWNNPVHSCPGDTRAAQFHDTLLPRLQSPTPIPTPSPSLEDDMAVLLRTPSDGKIWCVSGAGRWHVEDAVQELPLVEWNIIHGTTVTDLTDEQETGFALIPVIATPT